MDTQLQEVVVVDDGESGSEAVKWEKVLPRMVLRVLLVEADDSTRQIVAALLRKCNYKVTAVSDGLKAWEILKQNHNNIDLILTELDLPSISGYALLTLIMEHDGCKSIPVIIMSSQDSISLVLKCMLKGAADFLIKPVRRNELKNLWRHVWRKLAIDAGNNSQMLATGQFKADATFENHPASNQSSDNVSSIQKNSKSSAKATYAQSSHTTCLLEAESACVENMQEIAHHTKIVQLQDSDTEQKETELFSGRVQPSDKVNVSDAFNAIEDGSCTHMATADGKVDTEICRNTADLIGQKIAEPSTEVVDLIGSINKHRCTTGQSSSNGESNGLNSTAELELTLRSSHDAEIEEVDEKGILNHSSASAFSRYSENIWIFSPSTETRVADPCFSWPKAFTGNTDNKPKDLVAQSANGEAVIGVFPVAGGLMFDGGVWSSYGSLFQPVFSPPTVPTSMTSNSSDLGTQNEVTKQPSGRGGVYDLNTTEPIDPCNDTATQQNMSSTAYGSISEMTDVNGGKDFLVDGIRLRRGHHSAEREAALAKFRLKRKGRCFEKKVRYQSRKRLAEERPRVKGQFVRQNPIPSHPVFLELDKL